MMYIFIKNTAFAKAVHGVTLKDGYLPVIPFSYRKLAVLPDNIESAIWFKVLIVDFIIIDCNELSVQYKIRRSDVYDKYTNGPDGYLSTRQNLDEIDLDCFFKILLKQLKCQAKGEISNEEFYSALLRLLHCYILPLITFQQKHIPAIELAYSEEKNSIKIIDQEIDRLSLALYELENNYRHTIYNFLPSLIDDETDLHLYSKDFLIKINMGINKLLREIRSELDICQDAVESSKSEGNSEELNDSRQSRNSLCLKLVHLTSARENILEYLDGKRKKRFTGCLNLRTGVLEEVKAFKNIEKEMANLTNKVLEAGRRKVLATSVKEAIYCSIDDLKADGEYIGLETDKSGSRPTDVLDIMGSSSEWQTLKEQVATTLLTPNLLITKLHKEFSIIFKNKCVVSEYEHKLFHPWDSLHKIFKSNANISSDSGSNSTNDGSCNDSVLETIRPSRQRNSARRKGTIILNEPKNKTNEISDTEQNQKISEMKFLLQENHDVVRKKHPNSNGKRISEDDFVFVNTFNLTQLKEYLHYHMMEMCNYFQKYIDKDDTEVNLKSLWICYECHIFSEIFPSLMSLYTTIYYVPCQKLLNNLKHITWSHLSIDEQFLHNLITVTNDETANHLQDDLSHYSPIYNLDFKLSILNVIKVINSITKTTSIISLCKILSSSLRLINQKVCNNSVCADDLIAILTLILLHCEPELVAQLYIILNLLMNLLPDFLERGIYGYTLATYLMVYQIFFSNLNEQSQ